jgi:glycerol-3-phosphate acyltransferase PlsY
MGWQNAPSCPEQRGSSRRLFLESIQTLFPLVAALAAYLIGSLSFAVIVSRTMGLNDPRTYGSKNPGATNVLRSGNKAAAIVTLLLDAFKGWLPVMLVKWFGEPYGLGDGTIAMVGLAAFLGHLFPVFFRFVGGKGVATALGVLLATSWILGLATGITWLVIAYAFRYSSLASLVAAVFAPVYYVFGDGLVWAMDKSIVLSTAVMSLLLIWRHTENISRLVKGTESKLGSKKKA